MFSILIPTRNYDCTSLVAALHRQAEEIQAQQDCNRPYEIIVGDDGSTDAGILAQNRIINTWPNCRFYEHPVNIGRAAIRNRLAEEARYTYIIYIDCDARVENDCYLQRYMETALLCPVVCGGLVTTPVLPSANHSLRFRYEHRADRSRSAAHRSRHPYANFSTFNFMIRRNVLLDIRFDERCTQYGYEDALLGVCLQQRGIPVMHIDNPLVHTGIDTNAEFLDKSETALGTLLHLDESIQKEATVSQVARSLRRWHLLPVFRLFHRLFRDMERTNLLGTHPSLTIFSLYKLGYYCSLKTTSPDASSQPQSSSDEILP